MTDQKQNPLSKFFRQPQIYLKLPTKGKWWEPGSIELPATGELPIFAMTARDELIAKTPDALLNGQATVDIIESCCPAIKDAWKTPLADIDAILIAIRIATYGNAMDFSSVCPHCKTKNEHRANLPNFLDLIKCPDYDKTLKVGDLEFFFKPSNFFDFSQANIKAYEEQKIISMVQNENIDDTEKLLKFNQLFKKLLNLTVNQLSQNVGAIKTLDNVVVENREFIVEFFSNCDKEIWRTVEDHISELANNNKLKAIPVKCENEECLKDYDTPLVFELSSFFG